MWFRLILRLQGKQNGAQDILGPILVADLADLYRHKGEQSYQDDYQHPEFELHLALLDLNP
jgi:hypothetical protein